MPSTGQIEKLGSLGLGGQIGQGGARGRRFRTSRMRRQTCLAVSSLTKHPRSHRHNSSGPASAANVPRSYRRVRWPPGRQHLQLRSRMALPASSTMWGSQSWRTVANPVVHASGQWVSGRRPALLLRRSGQLRFSRIPADFRACSRTSRLTAGRSRLRARQLWVAMGPGTRKRVPAPAVSWSLRKAHPLLWRIRQLGLPLSRWVNANPHRSQCGWQLYLHASARIRS